MILPDAALVALGAVFGAALRHQVLSKGSQKTVGAHPLTFPE